MKIKFKTQSYQTDAVESVIDCFIGQQYQYDDTTYLIDSGYSSQIKSDEYGFRNSDIQLQQKEVLENIQNVQRRWNLSISDELIFSGHCVYNLDIEMETGTGKTYCYIKTIFEMNKRYGWSKFIIVVPSIAIREGVYKSLEITSEHFAEMYQKKARFFTYNSKHLSELECFSSDAGINIMIINIQAFNARSKDQRRIYLKLDEFQTRRPIDVISKNRPILILDEPQKMDGDKTVSSLKNFNPLMILRYSATHTRQHNKVYCLDALDAFNQKLVKKISVCGIQVRNFSGASPYMYLERIEVSRKAPVALIEIEIKLANGKINRQRRRLKFGCDLMKISNGLQTYEGYKISQIDANKDIVEFSNGIHLGAGEATNDLTELDMRRIQIRETICAHLAKEQALYTKGIKVLSLFFIDTVSKYRDYHEDDTKGEYARMFEEEYQAIKDEYLESLASEHREYRIFLDRDLTEKIHEGYFSIDKNSNRLVDPAVRKTGFSDDESAYDLILRNKERLLSQDEPVRFIFSHSALREGWDNPNVFTMCMLKHSDNTISRRQEVGRGLRLSVNQEGERMDNPADVHDINVLTVIASESYKDFVSNLQREMLDELSSRPRKANEAYFTGKILHTGRGDVKVTSEMAGNIEFYLIRNGYVNTQRQIVDKYHQDKREKTLASLPDNLAEYASQIFDLIDSVFSDRALIGVVGDSRKSKRNPLNDNFNKKSFRELWERINQKAIYRVDFDSNELIEKSIISLNKDLRVTPLQYVIQVGLQPNEKMTSELLSKDEGFRMKDTRSEYGKLNFFGIKYDLLNEIAEGAQLTRRTVARIFAGIKKKIFDQFKTNPEKFISEAARLIKEQKASMIIEQLTYDTIDERYDIGIFTDAQSGNDFSRAIVKLKKHVFDYAIVDSNVEKQFANDLDTSPDVVVYAKLPRGFLIPTPVGDYNPDWAISFDEGKVRHIYFVAETKGSISSMQLRPQEKEKIDCARKFFAEISKKNPNRKIRYDVIDGYEKLMDLVKIQKK